MEILRIRLLGGFALELDGRPVTGFRSAKSRALLAYLAGEPDRDHARGNLATLLWGDLPEAAARTNLRVELSGLKKLLSAHSALAISRTEVRFRSHVASIDTLDFEREVEAVLGLAEENQLPQLPRLARAVETYRGFLDGFQVDDAPDFEAWQLTVQQRLHEQALLALATLQRHHAAQGSWADLAAAARRQLALVPWSEPAHRHLMQALAAQGQIRAAREQYEACRTVLREELGIEPSTATQQIALRLQENGIATPAPRHNLTRQLRSFVGRERERSLLQELVQSEPVTSLLGIGGVGKSRLAQAVARDVVQRFADGVWFVPLADIEPGDDAPDRIALAIAAATGFAVTDARSPLAQLVAHLRPQRALLVLDNFEHLAAAADRVVHELIDGGGVHLLITSRSRLAIAGERSVRLEGLPPEQAFALFVDRARRLVPDFAAEGDAAADAGAVHAICREVAGLPLGIELVASWVEHVPAAQLGRSLTDLRVEPGWAADLRAPHHSLSGVLEYSWRLLDSGPQEVLSALSVFRGGFDRGAAADVSGSGLSELSLLLGHSLIQRIAAGRYDLHPLVQEFAAGKLLPQQRDELLERHRRHYLALLRSTERNDRAERLLDDLGNLRSAWRTAVAAGDATAIGGALSDFSECLEEFGVLSDGNRLLAEAVERFASDPESSELTARLLHRQWRFARAVDGIESRQLLQRALGHVNDAETAIEIQLELANSYAETGAWDEADRQFDQIEALSLAVPGSRLHVRAVEGRTHIEAIHFRGDYARGIARLEELAYQLDRLDDADPDLPALRFQVNRSRGVLAMRHRDYGTAIRIPRAMLTQIDELQHRYQKIGVLLDLALAEQFAGLYSQAIDHNLEALDLAEEIDAVDDMGLLKANLCLTLLGCGQAERGLAYGLEAVDLLASLGLKRTEGQARNRVGHSLLALERPAEAEAAYTAALEVWAPLNHPNRYEALAGRAHALAGLGRIDEGAALADEVLAFVTTTGLAGIIEPVLLLLNCERALTAAGRGEQAQRALRLADDWVCTVSDRIGDDAVRESFVQRPRNRLLHERLTATEAA